MNKRLAHKPRGRLLLAWITLVCFAAGCAPRLSSVLPSLSGPAEDEEVRISREFRREAKKHFKLITHPDMERYMDRIGQRIVSAGGPQPFEYRFFVIEDNQLNAFAVPGGSIYFNSGLIERARSTSEIAGVLGHEIIHIKGRHMARSSGPDAMSVLSLLGMILLARGGAGGAAAGAVGQAISATRQIAFSRQLEMEADTLGARYMAAAGFDPQGALGFLKTLDEERSLNPVAVPAYMLTHPVTHERVANMQQVIRTLGAVAPRVENPDPLKKIKIILRMERNDGDAVLAEYRKLVQQSPEDAEVRYLLAFAQQMKGQLGESEENYKQARELRPNDPALLRDVGKLYTRIGKVPAAEAAFKRSLELDPQEPLTYLYLGELYEQQKDYASAVGAYQNAQNFSPFWDKPPHHLGIAYGRLNRLGDAYYYLGRSLLLQDEDEKAFAAFEKAAKIAGNQTPRGEMIKKELDSLRSRRK